jgi:hypothetical protein
MVEQLGGTVPPKPKARIEDETEPGTNLGLVGVAGVALHFVALPAVSVIYRTCDQLHACRTAVTANLARFATADRGRRS